MDLKTYLHLRDILLLRKQLAGMDLDMDLPPFPNHIPEPPLVEEITVDEP